MTAGVRPGAPWIWPVSSFPGIAHTLSSGDQGPARTLKEKRVSERSDENLSFPEPPEGLLKAPVDRVVAHMDSPDAVAAAMADLGDAGFDRDEIFVLCGPKGAERLDVSGSEHGLGGRIYRLYEWVRDEHEVLLQAEQHLSAGGLVMSVPAGEDEMGTASRILRERGGHEIFHFGKHGNDWRKLGA